MASPGSAEREAVYEAIEALQTLAGLVERRRRQLARAVGLSDQQWRVLEGVSREHFMPSLFARTSEISPAALSRTLRHLQDEGLVRAGISAEDARQRDYALTRRGERAIDALRAAREEALGAVWDGYSRREIARFTRFANDLAERLARYAEQVEARREAD
jgi:DNA-binding MarR family transcriptional regulator